MPPQDGKWPSSRVELANFDHWTKPGSPLQGSHVHVFISCLWLCHKVECLGQILCDLQSQKYLLYSSL